MKTYHLTPLKAAILCLLFFFVQSCTTVVPGSWKNNDINSGKRTDFHQLNDQTIAYLKADDYQGVKTVLSKELIADNMEREIRKLSNYLNDNPYQLLDEYYAVHKYKDTDTVRSVGGNINRYNILYPYTAMEMYFAYLIPKKVSNKYMLSLTYAKFNYGWKIVKFDLEPYTINGKTGPELYALAKEQYAKKQIQAAYDNASLAVTCFKPGAYWQYPDETDAKRFYRRLSAEVDYTYKYPLVLKQVNTGPMILRVYTKTDDDGTYPMIYYMTHFPLKDTADVKKENVQVRSAVNKLMPGLDTNNKYILYSAFNKQPTGYSTVDHFDMKVKAH